LRLYNASLRNSENPENSGNSGSDVFYILNMKKSYILLLSVILIANTNAEENFSIQFNPLLFPTLTLICNMDIDFMPDEDKGSERSSPFCFVADVQFQYAINKKFTLFISPSFVREAGGLEINGTTHYRNNGLDFITGLLYRPYGTGLRGMYLGIFPVIGWGYITRDEKIIKDFLNIGYMTEIGYEWIWKKGLSLTLGFGICKIRQIPSSPSVFAPEIDEIVEYENFWGVNLWELPFDIRMRFSTGYSF